MKFEEVSNGGVCAGCVWVAAQGEIVSSTPETFIKFFGKPTESDGGPSIVINSSGGHDLNAALELGRLFRKYKVRTSIAETRLSEDSGGHVYETMKGKCLSSCAYAYLGGINRELGNDDELGFHQFFDQDILNNIDKAAFDGVARLKEQYIAGVLIKYLVEMDISTETFVLASTAGPNEIRYISRAEADRLRIIHDPDAMRPWKILPIASGLMLQSKSSDETRAVRLFCLRKQSGRVHLQIMNKSPDATNQLNNEYASGTAEKYFYKNVKTFKTEFRRGLEPGEPVDLTFNRVLSEPESGFHVNFDFTMSNKNFRSLGGVDVIYFWPGTNDIFTVNFWGQFLSIGLPDEVDSDLLGLVTGNCL